MVTVINDRAVRVIAAIIEGTEDEAHAAQEAIERPSVPTRHPGNCAGAMDNRRDSVR